MRKGDGESVSTTGAKTIHPIHRPAMTTLNSRLQLAMLNRKKGRNLLEKGFTLVELMIVIVIVGILSGVCLLYTSPSPRDIRRSRMPSSA